MLQTSHIELEQTRRFAIPDKLSFVLLAWTCAFLLPWQYNIPFILLLVVVASTFSPFKPVTITSRKYLYRFLAYSILLALVLVVVNGLLLREGSVRFTIVFVKLYEAGLEYGLTVSVRLILLSLSVLVFFSSIHFQEFAKYLQSVGLPHSLVSILLLTLFFLEQLPHRISRVFIAQEARGAPVRAGIVARSRAFFLILSPLVLSSIVESVERGAALELRGYHQSTRRKENQHEEVGFPPWRYVFLILSAIVIVLFIFHWLSN